MSVHAPCSAIPRRKEIRYDLDWTGGGGDLDGLMSCIWCRSIKRSDCGVGLRGMNTVFASWEGNEDRGRVDWAWRKGVERTLSIWERLGCGRVKISCMLKNRCHVNVVQLSPRTWAGS